MMQNAFRRTRPLEEAFADPHRRHRALGWLLALGCVLWMGWIGWTQVFNVPADMLQNHTSKVVQERMKGCEGSFSQRYQCKEVILVAGGRSGFELMLNRILLAVSLPIAAWVVWSAKRPR